MSLEGQAVLWTVNSKYLLATNQVPYSYEMAYYGIYLSGTPGTWGGEFICNDETLDNEKRVNLGNDTGYC